VEFGRNVVLRFGVSVGWEERADDILVVLLVLLVVIGDW